MRTQNRQMIRHRLRIRWANPDIDHRDAITIRSLQVIGWHLWQRVLQLTVSNTTGPRNTIARFDEFGIFATAQLFVASFDEGINIPLIIGQ